MNWNKLENSFKLLQRYLISSSHQEECLIFIYGKCHYIFEFFIFSAHTFSPNSHFMNKTFRWGEIGILNIYDFVETGSKDVTICLSIYFKHRTRGNNWIPVPFKKSSFTSPLRNSLNKFVKLNWMLLLNWRIT